jgi:methylmalonyl-CoA/ethylmalonyl-CoA epimerase
LGTLYLEDFKIMIRKIEHLGIAIADAQKARDTFEKLLGKEFYKTEEVSSEKVNTHFIQLGESKLELLEATSTESTIHQFIEKRKEGMHHIALDVDDIEMEMKRLQNLGFTFLNEKPKQGADNKLINFIHPKCTHGVLVELCQEIL